MKVMVCLHGPGFKYVVEKKSSAFLLTRDVLALGARSIMHTVATITMTIGMST